MKVYGPREKALEELVNEEIEIVEAFAEAEEYLNSGFIEDEFNYFPQD